jgi:hypothetical protein
MSDHDIDLDGLWSDRKAAVYVDKHPKTLPRWDKNPRMKELGWPAPVYINGHKHRPIAKVRAFVKNAAAAVTAKI